jgi:small-conductance mechanosensitive channel
VSNFLTDPIAIWAALLIIVLPVLILLAGEVQERLRQRGSPFEQSVALVRNWVLPLGALWVLIVLVFGVSSDNFFVQLLATATLVAATIAILQAIARLVEMAKARADRPGARNIPQLVFLLPRLVVLLVVAWLIVGSVWEVDISGLFAALGVTSLVISLALQPTLSGIASGLLLLGDRPFNPGDWIKSGDIEGRVLDLGWRTTKVEDRNGDVIVVPNSALSDQTLRNFAEPSRLHRVVVPVQVAYANPPTVAKEMLLAAARATPGVLPDPAPSIRVVQIDDPLMGYEADLWIDDYAIAPRVFSDFGSLVWYHSNRMGVPLPSPAYDLFHHDPVAEAAAAEVGTDQLAAALRATTFLSDLDDSDIDELAADATQTRFSRGEVIVPDTERHPNVYVLREGRARMLDARDPQRFVDLEVGEVFGFVAPQGRSASRPQVVAVDDCVLIEIDPLTAGAVASRNPALNTVINKIANNRFRRLTDTPLDAVVHAAADDPGVDSERLEETP